MRTVKKLLPLALLGLVMTTTVCLAGVRLKPQQGGINLLGPGPAPAPGNDMSLPVTNPNRCLTWTFEETGNSDMETFLFARDAIDQGNDFLRAGSTCFYIYQRADGDWMVRADDPQG